MRGAPMASESPLQGAHDGGNDDHATARRRGAPVRCAARDGARTMGASRNSGERRKSDPGAANAGGVDPRSGRGDRKIIFLTALLKALPVIRERGEAARCNVSTVALVPAPDIRLATTLLSRGARIMPDDGSAAS